MSEQEKSLALDAPSHDVSHERESFVSSRLASCRVPAQPHATATQSQRMWGFSLRDWLPRPLSQDGVVATAGEFERVREFLSQCFALFSEETQGAAPSLFAQSRKAEYLAADCDLMELRYQDETVGAMIGAPEDWSSYYVRMFAIRADFQHPGIVRRFARDCLLAPLAERGVERVFADTSPANLAMSRLLTELHFVMTGSLLSERWGPLIRYTRFLSTSCEAEFRRKFGGGAPAAPARRKKGG